MWGTDGPAVQANLVRVVVAHINHEEEFGVYGSTGLILRCAENLLERLSTLMVDILGVRAQAHS